MWSDTCHVSPGLYGAFHQVPVKAGVSSLKPKQLVSPAGGAPILGDVMNKFEVLGIVGEGGWFYTADFSACSLKVRPVRTVVNLPF